MCVLVNLDNLDPLLYGEFMNLRMAPLELNRMTKYEKYHLDLLEKQQMDNCFFADST